MKIDFLIGDNPYGSTVSFAKGFTAALKDFGVQTRLFWVADGHFYHAFYTLLDDPPDCTCSFSDISLDGKSLGSLWQIPHISLLLDPPVYFLHQLKGEYSWVSCVDQRDLAFVQSLGFKRSFFLPHGVPKDLKSAINQERHLDVVFFGTCIDYQAIENSWKKEERDLLTTASERVLSDAGVSIAEALIGLRVPSKEFARLHDAVDLYIRGKDRVELLRSLKGHRVHVWGDGPWEKYVPEAVLHPPISFDETINIMRQSKVVLNSSPRFKEGAHERIFYAFMCGASVYTGKNDYITHILPEIPTYRFGNWDHPTFASWQETAGYGQQRVLDNHTFHSRAEALLSNLN